MAAFSSVVRGQRSFWGDIGRLSLFRGPVCGCSLFEDRLKPAPQNFRTLRSAVCTPSTDEIKRFRYSTYPAQQMMTDSQLDQEDDDFTKETIAIVNERIESQMCGRLFAVVRIFGKQFKITTEDIIILQNHFVPRCGERVCLDKVLLVGNSDFTLLGRPLLNKDLVRVEATVIEKTLSHVITNFLFVKRRNVRRHQFRRIPLTMLRINSIEIQGPINQMKIIEGLEGRIV